TTGTWRPSPWSISTNTASGWPRWGRSVSRGRETASGDAKAAAQSTFTPEIAARMRNRSSKTAPNLQHGKYQDLIRGSLETAKIVLEIRAFSIGAEMKVGPCPLEITRTTESL